MSRPTCWRTSLIHAAKLSALISLLMLKTTNATTVHVNYTSGEGSDQQTPDRLTLSILNGSEDLGEVHLKRSPFNFNVPVYSLWAGPDGRVRCTQQNLTDIQNVGFYQDPSTDAVIQVTSTSGQGETKPRLLLKGELSLGGKKYTLSRDKRHKREASSSSSSSSSSLPSSSSSSSSSPMDDVYELTPEETKVEFRKDGLLAAPEIKISLAELLQDKPVLISLSHLQKSSTSSSDSNDPFRNQSPASSLPTRIHGIGRGRERMRRQIPVYYVDVVAVVDYGAYKRFLDDSSSRNEALEAIREYYAFVFNGMDLRYQNIPNINFQIRIRLTKVIVSETTSASSFTENYRVSGTPWDSVNALDALESFSEFAVGTGAEFLNPYDHSMLFTGYDLSSTTASGSTLTTTGLAYTGTLCRTDGKSVSIVEDLGGFQSIDTATHELGHSLSAKHDGEDNLCRSTDRFIMAGGTFPQTDANALNPWEFSVCSANYFSTFISDEMRNSRGRTCLTFPLSISASIPDVSDRLPGQEYSPDDQCVQIYGPNSRLCRGSEFGNDICTAMFCFDPATEGTCYEQTAARGTTCGNGKICLDGQCVQDSRAPAVADDCLFGDQPGAAFSGETCETFVTDFPGYCYQSLVRGRCCSSCRAIYRQITNCEYGDKVDGCRASTCPFASTSYLEQCCGTCNYGVPFTTKGTTKPSDTTATTAPPTTPKTTTTTSTVETEAPTTPSGCFDNPNILINNLSCFVAVTSFPSLCYRDDVLSECCASCQRVNTGEQGCEYGDRFPDGCSRVSSCVGLEGPCCDTCRGGGETPTTTTTTTVTTRDPASTCLDNPMIRVNGLTCSQAVNGNPNLCNVAQVLINCCLSCRQAGYDRDTTTAEATTTTPLPTTAEITTVTEAPVCRDNPLIQVNRQPCQAAIRDNPSLCYDSEVARTCCFTCSQTHTGINGCEYGDRFPDACANMTDCTGSVLQCCATCSSGNNNNNNNNNNNDNPNLARKTSASLYFTLSSFIVASVVSANLFSISRLGRWFL